MKPDCVAQTQSRAVNPPRIIDGTEIELFMAELFETEKYDEAEGYHYWDRPSGLKEERIPSGCCTNSARLVANKFGGKVFGFAHQFNKTAVVAKDCFGHDFAIVGDLLVDWWAFHFTGETDRPIYHLVKDAAQVLHLYGPRENWDEVPI